MPRDSTTLNTQLADTKLYPTRKVAGGQTICVTLQLADGVTFNPNALYGALKTLYGAAKVTSDHDSAPPYGSYQFRILP